MAHPKIRLLLEILDDMWFTDNWIDPLGAALQGWTVEHAQQPYAPGVFPIEAMVNHTAFWEEFGSRQLTGESLGNLGALEDATWGQGSTGASARRHVLLAPSPRRTDLATLYPSYRPTESQR